VCPEGGKEGSKRHEGIVRSAEKTKVLWKYKEVLPLQNEPFARDQDYRQERYEVGGDIYLTARVARVSTAR